MIEENHARSFQKVHVGKSAVASVATQSPSPASDQPTPVPTTASHGKEGDGSVTLVASNVECETLELTSTAVSELGRGKAVEAVVVERIVEQDGVAAGGTRRYDHSPQLIIWSFIHGG